MKNLLLLAAVLLGLAAAPTVAPAQNLSTYELRIANETQSGVKHIYATVSATGARLGDRLVGRIPPRTSAVIDLAHSGANCVMDLTIVFYDGDSIKKRANICRSATLNLSTADSDEF